MRSLTADLAILARLSTEHELTAYQALIERLAVRASEPLTLVVLGRMKAGKSTLLNRLCDSDLLPVGATRVTARMTELQGGPHPAWFRSDRQGLEHPVDRNQFQSLVRGQGDPGLVKDTLKLRAVLPGLLALGPVRLVDAPGFDSLNEQDEMWVRDYLPGADAVFYCTDSSSGLTITDLQRLRELCGDDPAVGGFRRVQVLLTKSDLHDSPGDAQKVLEQTQDQLQVEFGHRQARLVAAAPRGGAAPVGLEQLKAWIADLPQSGAKAERLRRQSTALAGRLSAELDGRLAALLDPARLAAEKAALQFRKNEIEGAVAKAEVQAYDASRLRLPAAAEDLTEGLRAFYQEEQHATSSFADMDEVKDYCIRFTARRAGCQELRKAWQGSLRQLAEPFRELPLHGIELPGAGELDRPLLSYIPSYIYTLAEIGTTIAMFLGSGPVGLAREIGEARQGTVLAEKLLAGKAGKLFAGLGSFIKGLTEAVPILKPLFFSVGDMAVDYTAGQLAEQLEARGRNALAEATQVLEGMPGALRAMAKLQGTLRREQDQALAEMYAQTERDSAARDRQVQALRTSLAELEGQMEY